MTSHIPKKRALHFGLTGHPTDPTQSPAIVQAKVTEGADRAREAGYEVQTTFFDLDDLESSFERLQAELATGRWDALIIGGGIRMTPGLTPEFERTVDIARRTAPETKILFQASPGDIREVLRRGFEEDEE